MTNIADLERVLNSFIFDPYLEKENCYRIKSDLQYLYIEFSLSHISKMLLSKENINDYALSARININGKNNKEEYGIEIALLNQFTPAHLPDYYNPIEDINIFIYNFKLHINFEENETKTLIFFIRTVIFEQLRLKYGQLQAHMDEVIYKKKPNYQKHKETIDNLNEEILIQTNKLLKIRKFRLEYPDIYQNILNSIILQINEKKLILYNFESDLINYKRQMKQMEQLLHIDTEKNVFFKQILFILSDNYKEHNIFDTEYYVNEKSSKIYFLIEGDEITYIGKTQTQWPNRINQHKASGKIFDRVRMFDLGNINTKELLDIENYLIWKLQPRDNSPRTFSTFVKHAKELISQ